MGPPLKTNRSATSDGLQSVRAKTCSSFAKNCCHPALGAPEGLLLIRPEARLLHAQAGPRARWRERKGHHALEIVGRIVVRKIPSVGQRSVRLDGEDLVIAAAAMTNGWAPPAASETIEAALARAYQNNPQLNAQRAVVARPTRECRRPLGLSADHQRECQRRQAVHRCAAHHWRSHEQHNGAVQYVVGWRQRDPKPVQRPNPQPDASGRKSSLRSAGDTA